MSRQQPEDKKMTEEKNHAISDSPLPPGILIGTIDIATPDASVDIQYSVWIAADGINFKFDSSSSLPGDHKLSVRPAGGEPFTFETSHLGGPKMVAKTVITTSKPLGFTALVKAKQ